MKRYIIIDHFNRHDAMKEVNECSSLGFVIESFQMVHNPGYNAVYEHRYCFLMSEEVDATEPNTL